MVPNALKGILDAPTGGSIPILGYVVYWNVLGVEVTRDWFKAKLDEVGIDGERYAKDHNYRSTFCRCVQMLESNRIIRKVTEDSTTLVYQFTAETLIKDADNSRLEYTPETQVKISKDEYSPGKFGEALTCDDKLRPILVEAFEREHKTYRSSDITRYVQRILSDEADIVSLRPQGSVYFVPAAYQGLINNLSQVLAAVPKGTATLEFFPVPDVASARQMVGNGVAAEITEIFSKMEEEVKAMNAGSDTITPKWVDHRKTRIKEIKARLDAYAEVLGDTAKRLGGSFDVLDSLLKTRTLEL